MLWRLKSLVLLLVWDACSKWKHIPPHAWTVLTSGIWDQAWSRFGSWVLGPHIRDDKPQWPPENSASLQDGFGCFCAHRADLSVRPDRSSDVANRTCGFREVATGSPCQVCRGLCESYQVVKKSFPKEHCLPFLLIHCCLYLCRPWAYWNIRIPQSCCCFTLHF